MAVRYSNLTLEQKQQIISAHKGGMECRDIPDYLGVSGRSVARVLADAGVNTKRRNRYTLNESYFDKIDTSTKAYLLGLLAADGCVTEKNYVAFESIDRELTELLKNELRYSGEIRLVQFQNYASHHRINFSSKGVTDALRRWGILTERSFSDIHYFPEKEYLAPYVLGYFDGDGCAYVNKNRSGGSVCIVGSLEFAAQLKTLLEMGSVDQHSAKRVYYWRIHSRQHTQAFYHLIYQYSGLGLQRKKQKIEAILGSYSRG